MDVRSACLTGALGWLAGCTLPASSEAVAHDGTPAPRAAAVLGGPFVFAVQRAEERAYKQQFDPRIPPDARGALGPDPSRIVALPGGGFAVTLTAPGEVALFDRDLVERDRLFAMPGAAAIALDEHGTLWVGATSRRDLVAMRVHEGRLERLPALDRLDFASLGVRDVTSVAGCLYAVDEHASELLFACGSDRTVTRSPLSGRPIAVAASPRFAVVTSAVGHTISVFPLSGGAPVASAVVTVRNDGPFFGAAIREREDGSLIVASGGVEDHPLDRRGGSFGYIDSFVYVDAVEQGAARRLAAVDVGELGVITPKALVLTEDAGVLRVDVTSFGASAAAHIELAPGAPPISRRTQGAPGLAAVVSDADGGLVATSPLLDALVRLGPSAEVAPVVDHAAAIDARLPPRELLRLGEALFYTNAMGPFQRSEGELSRFTCESCHFEGGIDGRVHRTGRGEVVATTKPLFGLGNNGPHFTRALDLDLTQMVFAEFRVAAANSGHSEWFTLDEAGLDWRPMSEATATDKSPAELRRALVLYLASVPHARNSRTLGRTALTSVERRGAALFAAHCEGCHQARLASSDPSSRVPFAEWESLVLAPAAPLVWARDGYEKTGVTPYVHDAGARPSSLRRIAEKTPYFTNGSAKTLAEVVARGVVTDDDVFLHADEGAAAAPLFDEAEVEAVVAFLDLL